MVWGMRGGGGGRGWVGGIVHSPSAGGGAVGLYVDDEESEFLPLFLGWDG